MAQYRKRRPYFQPVLIQLMGEFPLFLKALGQLSNVQQKFILSDDHYYSGKSALAPMELQNFGLLTV